MSDADRFYQMELCSSFRLQESVFMKSGELLLLGFSADLSVSGKESESSADERISTESLFVYGIGDSTEGIGKSDTGIVLSLGLPLVGKRYSKVSRTVIVLQRIAKIIIPTVLSNRAPGKMISSTRPEAFTMPWSIMLAQMERIR